jgi:hypothetical protein
LSYARIVGNPAQALWLKSIEVFNEQGFVDVDPITGTGVCIRRIN